MVTPTTRTVVSVPFPFSDLSRTKLRPAVILAGVGRDEWILCQVTSKPYGDPYAIVLTEASFARCWVAKYDKLLSRILRGTSDANIPFEDLRQLLKRLVPRLF